MEDSKDLRGMRILRLTAENVKRLDVVEITPKGDVVVIGGKNGAGKSSVLDAITYALGGKTTHCREPVRRGEDAAEVVVDLGDVVVKRTFKKDGGGQLTVSAKDGARYPSPQSVLDRLVGELTLDPLEFTRMEAKAQAEALRRLLGLDFSEIDGKRRAAYEDRTIVNREGKALRARVDAMPPLDDSAPAEEVNVSDLIASLREVEGHNREASARADAATRAASVSRDASETVTRLRAALDQAMDAERDALTAQQVAEEAAKAHVPRGTSEIEERIGGAEEANARARQNAQRAQAESALEAKRDESAALTERIDALDAEKAAAIAGAKMPVGDMGFDADGFLTLGGIPFDQASSAEQLRVSVAMAIAANPKLRVLLIRDGSLLDDESLALVAQLAAEHDAQVWIERVEDDEHVGVVIEDGRVRGKA